MIISRPHKFLRTAVPVLPWDADLAPDRQWQLVDGLYAQRRSLVDGSAALVLVALACFGHRASVWYLVWALLAAVVLAARLALTSWYSHMRRAEFTHQSPHHWARLFTFGAIATAAIWGAGSATVLATSQDQVIVAFVLIVQAGWIAGASVRNNASPAAAAGQLLVTLVPDIPAAFFAADHAYRMMPVFFVLQATANWSISRHLTVQTISLLRSETHLADLNNRLVAANTDLADANCRLYSLSATDGLTGIANRRAFDEALQKEWSRASRNGTELSLLMIDVDFFKAFNDMYGHPAGDSCLCRSAVAIQAGLRRPPDLAARFGGEEFVALLPGTTPHGARDVAERLRRDVEALAIPHLGSPNARVTVSIGVACVIPQPGDAAMGLIEAADQALYRAKHTGRNRVFPNFPPREAVA